MQVIDSFVHVHFPKRSLPIWWFLFIASFGELSFNADYNHSRRNAGVISDGNHGQTRVQIQSSQFKSDTNHNEMNASNVAILLLIPERTYMDELYTSHASKHQTKEKVSGAILHLYHFFLR